MLSLPVAGLMQTLGDVLVIGIVLGLAAFGASSGLFVATLSGMHTLVSFVVALGFSQPFAELLIGLDMPPIYAFPAAFGILAVGSAVAIRLLIGHYVPADAVEFEPIIEKVGGGLLGSIAGIIVAGTLLVALSIMPLPDSLRIDSTQLRFDLGSRMLRTFARITVPDRAQQQVLLDGDTVGTEGDGWKLVATDEETGHLDYPEKKPPPEPPADSSPLPEYTPPPPGLWSEPFADLNGNGEWDDGEPYLDLLADKQFTKAAIYPPKSDPDPKPKSNRDHKYVGEEGKFFVGLQERYRRNQWERWRMVEATWEDVEAALTASEPKESGNFDPMRE